MTNYRPIVKLGIVGGIVAVTAAMSAFYGAAHAQSTQASLEGMVPVPWLGGAFSLLDTKNGRILICKGVKKKGIVCTMDGGGKISIEE